MNLNKKFKCRKANLLTKTPFPSSLTMKIIREGMRETYNVIVGIFDGGQRQHTHQWNDRGDWRQR